MDVKLFKTIGLYQLLRPTGKIFRTRLKLIVKVMVVLHLTLVFSLYFTLNDMQRFATMAVLAISGMSCLFKGYVLVTHGDDLWNSLAVTGYGYVEASRRDSSELRRCEARLTTLLRILVVCSYSTLFIWAVGPYFADGYESVTNRDGTVSEYRITVNNQWVLVPESVYNLKPVWALFYVTEVLMLFINVFCWTNFDCYLITMCFVLNSQFHNMSAGFGKIGHRGPARSSSSSSSSSSPSPTENHMISRDEKKDSYDELIRYLKDNQKIMQKLDDFFNIVRPAVLVQIGNGSCSVIILIFLSSLMYITGEPILSTPFLKFFSGFISLNIQLYIYCYVFTYIETKKDTLNFGLYSSNWSEMDIEFKKTLLVAMQLNSAHKRQMKISTESIINLEMFTRVMNLSFSIVSVLLNFNNQ